MLKIDLHCHSDRSDGALTPGALMARAAARGVHAIALTDHDTTDGLDGAYAAAAQHGIELVTGVEISVTWNGQTLHVVGLGIDPSSPALRAGLGRLRSGRLQRAESIGRRLDRLGVHGSLDGAMALAANPDMIGRMHFARHLVASGAVNDMKAAFRRYLGDGKPGYVRHRWADFAEATGWIVEAGGIPVLAHPGRYGLRPARLLDLCNEFRACGGVAVEVLTASHTAEQSALVARLAGQSGLSGSVGSDFHDEQSWLDLGQLPALPPDCKPVWHALPLDCAAAFQ